MDHLRDEASGDRWHGYSRISNLKIKHLKYLSEAAKDVYDVLCFHANADGKAWPSIERLSMVTGCCHRTVFRALKTLEKLGMLRRTKRFRQTTVYCISGIALENRSDKSMSSFDWGIDSASEPPAGRMTRKAGYGDIADVT
jgi:hypothetical protein